MPTPLQDGQMIELAGTIIAVTPLVNRAQSPWATLTLRATDGTVYDVLVFPQTWAEHGGNVAVDAAVRLRGRVDLHGQHQVIAREIEPASGAPASWPDTRDVDPPTDHLYASAVWLLGRHPQLAELAARVPGVVEPDPDPEPDADGSGLLLDLETLAQAVHDHDDHAADWESYTRHHLEPQDDDAYERWRAAGPTASDTARAIGQMSGTEQARLRLLAVFAGVRVPFRVLDLHGLDDEGQRLLADWCAAVMAA